MTVNGEYWDNVEECNNKYPETIEGEWVGANNYMTTDEVAVLLVKLYADYQCGTSNYDDAISEKYAKAVGIAIRMLSD